MKTMAYARLEEALRRQPLRWGVTGAAGFIGSHLVERLLRLDQRVLGLDSFATGRPENLDQIRQAVSAHRWERFRFIRGDIGDPRTCRRVCQGTDYLLHEAALGSVPRSLKDPLGTHAANVTGFLNILVAARDARVRRVVYASSSAVYGDQPDLPKREDRIGRALSPYAASKDVNELYADVFARCYGLESIGLRYFNVFGPRQDPEGPYAAVIPKWIAAMMRNRPVEIYGDGRTSRDFCYIENVVQANLLAAAARKPGAANQIYNIALDTRTSLNELFTLLRDRLLPFCPRLDRNRPIYRAFRVGDVRHSQADISKARRLLGYAPTHGVADGLDAALDWYRTHLV
jgi:UDP-N-acetylglucosamine 4-epimerase